MVLKKNSINLKRASIVSIRIIKEGIILYSNRKIQSHCDAADLLRSFPEYSDREMLIVCCLATKNQPTPNNTVSIGTLNLSLVYPRKVLNAAVLGNSTSVIISHNHPSGDTTP